MDPRDAQTTPRVTFSCDVLCYDRRTCSKQYAQRVCMANYVHRRNTPMVPVLTGCVCRMTVKRRRVDYRHCVHQNSTVDELCWHKVACDDGHTVQNFLSPEFGINLFWRYPDFLTTQRSSQKNYSHAKNQLEPFSCFDRQTQARSYLASTAACG